jgi:hypothetical protein
MGDLAASTMTGVGTGAAPFGLSMLEPSTLERLEG